MKLDIKDLIIDEEDRKLFLIDDIALKAEALKQSILPRLENLLYTIIKEINEIYQIDLLEESKISKSPNFRKSNRNEPVKINYESCSVWLCGKIKPNYWKNLIKKTGEISQYTPFVFQIQLSGDEILCFLAVNSMFKLSYESYQIFDNWIEKNFLKLFPLIQAAGVDYSFFYSEECKPLTPLDSYFSWKRKEEILESGFFSESITYPLDEKQFKKIINIFLYLFPIYQTFIDLSKGYNDNFDKYLSYLQDYELRDNNINDSEDSDKIENNHDFDLNRLVDQKIKVLPGIRWQVFSRDNWKCIACGRNSEDGIILHVDHIIPRSKGGQNELLNYQTLCNICNIGKSNKDDTNIRLIRE
jgi:hypothetical protein